METEFSSFWRYGRYGMSPKGKYLEQELTELTERGIVQRTTVERDKPTLHRFFGGPSGQSARRRSMTK
jgi:hypothetical protein